MTTTDIEKVVPGQGLAQAAAEAANYDSPNLMLSDKMPALVKGAGYAKPGGNRPLDDDEQIFKRSMQAEASFRKSIKSAIENPQGVVKGMNPGFRDLFGTFLAASPQNQAIAQLTQQISGTLSAELGKNITLTSPLASGLVPFDLVAPSR